MNQPFPKAGYQLASLLFLEVHLFVVSGAKTQNHASHKAKKMKNVKELLNLFITENMLDNSDIALTKKLNLGFFRMLSDFLMIKMKSSDTFNMLIEKEVFNDINEFQNKSFHELDIPPISHSNSEKRDDLDFWQEANKSDPIP